MITAAIAPAPDCVFQTRWQAMMNIAPVINFALNFCALGKGTAHLKIGISDCTFVFMRV